MVRRKRTFVCLLLLLLGSLALPGCSPASAAAAYYVAPGGSDANPGTQSQPFQTVQKGIEAAADGDTVYIQSGTYDLQKLNITLRKSIRLIGEDKNTTILTNGRKITFHRAITVQNLQFKNFAASAYNDAVLQPIVEDGETINGAVIDNLIVDNVPNFIWGASESTGTLKNITITNNQVSNILSTESNVYAVNLNTNGELSGIRIANNTFKNIKTMKISRSAFGILIGSDENHQNSVLPNPHAIVIENNTIEHIFAGTLNPGYPPSGKGIMIYGEDITIDNNRVIDINPAPAHEGIYIKAKNSRITNNIVHNGGTSGTNAAVGAGDITIKGLNNYGNVISGNTVTSDYSEKGIGIVVLGGAEITSNYIKKATGYFGIFVGNSEGRNVLIKNNYIETSAAGGQGIKISDADRGVITGNVIITYSGPPLFIGTSATNIHVGDNKTCEGFGCASLMQSPAPTPTGQ